MRNVIIAYNIAHGKLRTPVAIEDSVFSRVIRASLDRGSKYYHGVCVVRDKWPFTKAVTANQCLMVDHKFSTLSVIK